MAVRRVTVRGTTQKQRDSYKALRQRLFSANDSELGGGTRRAGSTKARG